MKSKTIYPPNAVLFVFDPSNASMDVPAYIPGEPVAYNNSCVSINTRAYVDGDVTIIVGDKSTGIQQGPHVVFNEIVQTPGKRLAVETSELEIVWELEVSGHETVIEVSVDDLEAAGLIVIEVK